MKQLLKTILPIMLLVMGLLYSNTGATQAQDTPTLVIPALEIETPILSAPLGNGTWDVSGLNWTVAHMQGLPWFGTQTNIALGGHSTDVNGNPEIFYNLHTLQPGDEIFVHVDGATRRYVVDHLDNVSEYDVRILYPTPHEQLTIFTCDIASYSDEAGWYTRRTVVVAYPA